MKTRKVLALVLALTMVMTLAGCGKMIKIIKVLTEDEDTASQSENVDKENKLDKAEKEDNYSELDTKDDEEVTFLETEISESLEDPEIVALSVARLLYDKNYDKLAHYMFKDECYVTAEDIEYALAKNEAKLLESMKEDLNNCVYNIEFSEQSGMSCIELRDAENDYHVASLYIQLEKGRDNLYRFLVNGAAVNNWKVAVPIGCTISIDGKEVTDVEPEIYADDMRRNVYSLSNVGLLEKTVTVSNENFTYETVIEPSEDKVANIEIIASPEEEAAAIEYIADIWQGMMSKHETGELTLDYIKSEFIHDESDTNTAEDIMSTFNGDDVINNGPSSATNIKLTKTVDNLSENSVWVTGNRLKIHFGLEATFDKHSRISFVDRKYTEIDLIKDRDTYKIASIDKWMFTLNFSEQDF